MVSDKAGGEDAVCDRPEHYRLDMGIARVRGVSIRPNELNADGIRAILRKRPVCRKSS
jgi:hypothetical protein